MTHRELAIRVIRTLRRAGCEALLAGGCVRDSLLGRRPKDYDVATSARPEEVQRLFRRTLAIGAAFGVIVVLEGDARVEVATFRADAEYADGRHPSDVRFTSAKEDAKRRDFTINALFRDPIGGEVIDCVGGVRDLERGLVRAVGDAEARFREDHLRMLRAVRFTARLGFRLAPSTRKAIEKLAPLVKKTSGERIRDELAMMLVHPSRAEALRLADKVGLLEQVLPEVTAMKGVRQGKRVHPEGDAWEHTLLCMKSLRRPSFVVAMATLLHDVGKPPTADYSGGDIRFYDHPGVGAEMAGRIARRLRMSAEAREEIMWVTKHHMDFMQARQMRRSTLRRMFQHAGFRTLAEVQRADALGSMGSLADYRYVMRQYRQLGAEEIRPEPLVRGGDLLEMGLVQGPAVGRVLRRLYDEQLEGRLRGRREALDRARTLADRELAEIKPKREISEA